MTSGSGVMQIPPSEAAWRLRLEQQAVRCGLPVNRPQSRILDASPTVLLGMRIGGLSLTAAHYHQLTFPGRWIVTC
jgi:hypothetical protein